MPWWPPLQDLKDDLGVTDDRDDVALAVALETAVAFVEQVRGGEFNFTADEDSTLPAPTPPVVLGTVRLAGRWFNRRRSPDGLIDMGELGSTRVPTVDPDIERMLGIGRYRAPMVG